MEMLKITEREALADYLGCSLKRPTETRWNSFHDSLKQICALKDKLSNISLHLIMQLITLRVQNFDYIEEYLEVSKPLARSIDELQAEKKCHNGYLLPTLISIRSEV